MPLIVALVADRVGRARLRDAMRGLAAVHCCDSAAEARAAALGPDIGAVVVEPRDPSGTSTDALVAALRRERPAVPVLAYCSLGRGIAADIHAVTRAGASTIVLRGYDDERVALRRASMRPRLLRAERSNVPKARTNPSPATRSAGAISSTSASATAAWASSTPRRISSATCRWP
jgi:hypothetical protein